MKKSFAACAVLLMLLSSCGKEAPFQARMSEDGVVRISVSDLELDGGAVGLPFFPPEVTADSFKSYVGMTQDEFSSRYMPSADAGRLNPNFCLEGLYALAILNGGGSDGSPGATIWFTYEWDNTPEEWADGTRRIAGWLEEHMTADEAAGGFISEDGRTRITVRKVMVFDEDNEVIRDENGTAYWGYDYMTFTYES